MADVITAPRRPRRISRRLLPYLLSLPALP